MKLMPEKCLYLMITMRTGINDPGRYDLLPIQFIHTKRELLIKILGQGFGNEYGI